MELIRDVAEGKPLAGARLQVWALVLGHLTEDRDIPAARWLANRAGCGRTYAHQEREAALMQARLAAAGVAA